jgi:hypothetical protein
MPDTNMCGLYSIGIVASGYIYHECKNVFSKIHTIEYSEDVLEGDMIQDEIKTININISGIPIGFLFGDCFKDFDFQIGITDNALPEWNKIIDYFTALGLEIEHMNNEAGQHFRINEPGFPFHFIFDGTICDNKNLIEIGIELNKKTKTLYEKSIKKILSDGSDRKITLLESKDNEIKIKYIKIKYKDESRDDFEIKGKGINVKYENGEMEIEFRKT